MVSKNHCLQKSPGGGLGRYLAHGLLVFWGKVYFGPVIALILVSIGCHLYIIVYIVISVLVFIEVEFDETRG